MSDLRLLDTSVPKWEGTYVLFELLGVSDSGKTQLWTVFPKMNSTNYLGTVQWFAHWRKYAFYPNPETVYEETCLNDISTFIKMLTRKHKSSTKSQKDERRSKNPRQTQ